MDETALPEHVRRNRSHWDELAAQYVANAEENWARHDPVWGIWGIPESEVRLLPDQLEGRDVIVVEDIVDTGHTLAYLLKLLGARGPASLNSCTLLRKPDRSEVEIDVAYLGFDIPDVWVVGYGLDFAERHRTLPSICVIAQS